MSGDEQKIGNKRRKRRGYENSEGAEVVNRGRTRRIMKSTILSWLIDEGTVQEYTRVLSVNELSSEAMKIGHIRRCGIQCRCCDEVLSVENFYVHGGRTCDKPYEFILVSGRKEISLLECMRRSWNKSSEIKFHECNNIRISRAKDSYDDTCIICADGGNLICCDKCSSIYHPKCMYMTDLPAGSWFCPYCVCIFCAKPCVENDDRCPQCAKHYHRKCHDFEYKKFDLNRLPTTRLPTTTPYCQGSCEQVYKWAKSMVGRRNDLNEGYSWTLLCRREDDDDDNKYARLLRHSKLAVARRLMQECFDPIVDRYTKVDVIPSVVYNCGSNFPRVDYTGFYTAILEKDDVVISAASLRIHGTKLAEMPFIATMEEYRRKGMCKRLMAAIELDLRSLNVEHLVVPSVDEKVELWTEQFGFRPLDAAMKKEFAQYKIVLFHDSVILQKNLLPFRVGPDGPQDA